jgi:hypothetical protein
MKSIFIIMLLTLACSCALVESGRRINTATYDAVVFTDLIPIQTVKEIEAGIVDYTINTIRTNNPSAYRDLSEGQLLDLRRYKRQYSPVFQEVKPGEEIRVVEITLIADYFAKEFYWLHSPLAASDGWIGLIYVRYDLKDKKFLSAHTGGIS